MYYLITLPNRPDLPIIDFSVEYPETYAEIMDDNQILSTDPDLSYFSAILSFEEMSSYSLLIKAQDVLDGKISIETIKNSRHYILLSGRYEITGKLCSMVGGYFKIRHIMGDIEILTKQFHLGDPIDY